jgi:hypothetical protein
VRWLISKGAALERIDCDGRTAACQAASAGLHPEHRAETLRVLLEAGVSAPAFSLFCSRMLLSSCQADKLSGVDWFDTVPLHWCSSNDAAFDAHSSLEYSCVAVARLHVRM